MTETQRWINENWAQHDTIVRERVARASGAFDPDDIVNSLVLKLLENDSLKNQPFQGFSDAKIRTALVNWCGRQMIDMKRRATTHTKRSIPADMAEVPTPEDHLLMAENTKENARLIDVAEQAFGKLSKLQQEVLEAVYDDNPVSYTEYARRRGTSCQAVRNNALLGLKKLREYMRTTPPSNRRVRRIHLSDYANFTAPESLRPLRAA